MTHMIMKDETGKDAIAYAGKTPWHRLGQEASGLMTSAEALQMARLDWKVRKEQVFVKFDNEELVPVPNTFATVRGQQEGNGSIILTKSGKTVGPQYTIFQNQDAFQFIDELINSNEATIEVAGALDEGQRVWVLARLPKDMKIGNNDKVIPYILISNSHDGSGSIKILPTPVRVVCNNTLTMALGRNVKNKFILRHTKNAPEKVEKARKVLQLVHISMEQWEKDANRLKEVLMTPEEMSEYFEYSLGLVRDEEGEMSTRAKNILEEVNKCVNHSTNRVEGMEGTAWAAYNALTYYVDHIGTIDSSGFTNNNKVQSALMGSMMKKKEKGWELAMEMLV